MKNYRVYRKCILAGMLVLQSVVFTNVNAQQQPNIVFILTDDQRLQGTIHALDGNEIITPNIDLLANRGTVFTSAYIMGGNQAAVCTPSRNMIMTGRNLFSIGGNNGMVIQPQYSTLGEVLGKNGYLTYGIGKWHNDKPSFNRSFQNGDEIFFDGMGDQFNKPLYHYNTQGVYDKKIALPGGDSINADHLYPNKHSSEIFAENAVRFINSYDHKQPFFLYVAFTAPHDPREMPAKYKAMYDTARIAVPKNFLEHHPFDNGELMIRDEKLAAFPRKPAEIKTHIRDYYAMMTHMDEQIGNIIKALKDKGVYKNTIIVFAGDNGLALGQQGLMGKQNVYEHSIKVPLIFVGKNIPAGKIKTEFVYLSDIFPTICGLTNIRIPSSVQGLNILGKNPQKRTAMLYAYRDFQRAVRKGDWKLIVYNVKGVQTIQLFNLKKDPLEMNNLAADKNWIIKLGEMELELQKQKELIGDK
jgi:arylsulfatase A-like enzyme